MYLPLPRPPTLRYQSCHVGANIVNHAKFHQNRLSGLGSLGVEIFPFPMLGATAQPVTRTYSGYIIFVTVNFKDAQFHI